MLRDALKGLGGALLYAYSYAWILWWGVGMRLRRLITGVVGVVSIAGLLLTALRIALAASGIRLTEVLREGEGTGGQLRPYAGILQWTLQPPLWIYALLLVFVVIALVSRHRENVNAKRRPRLAAATRDLLTAAAQRDSADETGRQSYIANVFTTFQFVMEEVAGLQMNVMTPNALGRLEISHKTPGAATYDAGFSLGEGEGAAGRVLKDGATVYIPSRRQHHGILIEWPKPRDAHPAIDCVFKLVPDAFKPSKNDRFKSVLSCPVRIDSTVVGVLNFESQRSNAFSEAHFLIAEVAAGFVALGMTSGP